MESYNSGYFELSRKSDMLSFIEFNQINALANLNSANKSALSQYFTPSYVALFMAGMFDFNNSHVKILDPGAGAGMLFAAAIYEILSRKVAVSSIEVVAYEIDPSLKSALESTMKICGEECKKAGIGFTGEIRTRDFIEDSILKNGLLGSEHEKFTHVITNPPYKKLNTGSPTHKLLDSVGRGGPNLYTAFLSMCDLMLEENGQLVSITPRSFCNGVYFVNFRKGFMTRMRISRMHLFTSRSSAFRYEDVLQENIIIKWIKSKQIQKTVMLTSSEGLNDEAMSTIELKSEEIVKRDDPEQVIWVIKDSYEKSIKEKIERLPNRLKDLGLTVSTGPVVDFRSTRDLSSQQFTDSVPLIQPECISTRGRVNWEPSKMRKAPFIYVNGETMHLLLSNEVFVLTKRFSSNEEKRRIVASLYFPIEPYEFVGFENRVNYFHRNGRGLDLNLAKGLVLYLNSTIIDSYFRQMSGHTQVNSSDLSRIHFPSADDLISMGTKFFKEGLVQEEIDKIVEREIFNMVENDKNDEPILAKKKVTEASEILKSLGLPKPQTNEISALTLLSLLGLKPIDPWSSSHQTLIGIHNMLQFFKENYGKEYAENTRETVRRRVLHQFCQANIAVLNPDDPERPINSGKTVYKIEPETLELIKTFGTNMWPDKLKEYLSSKKTLLEIYNGRIMGEGLKVKLPDDQTFILTHGGQNVLVKAVIEQFIPRYIKGPKILYLGDTGNKFLYYDKKTLESLNVFLEPHGQIPDIIVLDQKRNWLCLIEAVTSHGPIDGTRRVFLDNLFGSSYAPPVYITAFSDRESMKKYLPVISWHTEVWVAESPDHLIHFNGERFLGPYTDKV